MPNTARQPLTQSAVFIVFSSTLIVMAITFLAAVLTLSLYTGFLFVGIPGNIAGPIACVIGLVAMTAALLRIVGHIGHDTP